LQDLGFWILNDVVWRKTTDPTQGRRFTNAHETLIWATRIPSSNTLNFRSDEGAE